MADFALLLYKGENEKENSIEDRIRDTWSAAKDFFKGRVIEESTKKVELHDSLNMYLINLPYSYSKFAQFGKGKRNKLIKEISEICKKADIKSCVHPCKPILSDKNEIIKNTFTGQQLYIALLVNILDTVCMGGKTRPCELNIGIVHGADIEKLNIILKLLSEHVKYVTVISNNKETIEEEINNIYEETGLSVAISEDLRRGAEAFDIIISTANFEELKVKSNSRDRTVIINYGETEYNKENLINGIEVEFPSEFREKLNDEIFENYKSIELAEAFLSHRTGNEKGLENKPYDFSFLNDLSQYFKKDCYSINDLSGKIVHL